MSAKIVLISQTRWRRYTAAWPSSIFARFKTQAVKVCVVGGAGGIGQPMSMLLKLNPDVSHVSVFDMVGAPGVAADLSHIDTPASVSGHGMTLKQFTGPDAIDNKDEFQAKAFDEALNGCDIVVSICTEDFKCGAPCVCPHWIWRVPVRCMGGG